VEKGLEMNLNTLRKIKNTSKKWLLNSPGFFQLRKTLHYRKYRINESLTQHKDILKTLVEDGVVIIPNFCSQTEIDSILSELMPTLDKVVGGSYSGSNKFHRFPELGVYRLLQADTISPAAKSFFENSFIESIAKAYVGPEVKSFQRMIEIKPSVGYVSSADFFHVDDWKQRFKSFLYLNDVSDEEAPFVYVKKSHRGGSWRTSLERDIELKGNKGSLGSFFPWQAEEIFKEYGLEPKACTGKAGTLILTDTRGLHRGTVLRKNRRVLLANYFDVR
jgi:hypothetical protein